MFSDQIFDEFFIGPEIESVIVSETIEPDLRDIAVELKDFEQRKFNYLVDNFYVLRSALRYYSVKKGTSFTSSKLSEDFPIAVTVAGSSLNILTELGIVEPRRRSSSPDRYLPEEVDLQRMIKLGDVLAENHEIKKFNPDKK
ncbi:MAG: hypothetical protein J07AB43_16830 [Candidatus Nanosalina sp. J07AB43]|nr:MAG: hypothetical protein J07AB43_16830 [Candidatus Nanosalina sp. J07AB43]